MTFPKFLRIASVYKDLRFARNTTVFLKIKPINVINSELIKLLAKKFGFSYEFVSPTDTDYGRLFPNGSWSGMVGMVHRGDADIIIDDLSVTESRSKVIDFSQPYSIDRWTFATKFMKQSHSNIFFLKPFSVEVWIAIIISFFLASLIAYILFKENNTYKNLNVFRSPTKSSVNSSETYALYILRAGCMIAEIFIRLFFTSLLLSYLVIPPLNDVRTIQELGKAVLEDRYRCASYGIYYLTDIMYKSEDPHLKIIGHSLSKYKGSSDIENLFNNTESRTEMAYIGTETYLKIFTKRYFVSEDGFLPDLISIGIKKDFCCKDQLNSVLNYILASGIFNRFINYEYFHKIVRPTLHVQAENTYRPLSIKDIEGLFALLSVGCTVSIVILFIEILVDYIKNDLAHIKGLF